MSNEKDREDALKKQAQIVSDKQARRKKRRPKLRRVYAYEECEDPHIFQRVDFGHPRQLIGYVWPGQVDPDILKVIQEELLKHPSHMPAVAPEDPEQEKMEVTEKEINGITPGDEQSSDPKKCIYTGPTRDPESLMWEDPLLKLDSATRIWAEEWAKIIEYYTRFKDADTRKRWASDVQHVVSFKLANLSVKRKFPHWAIERDYYRINQFLYFLYPDLETNPTQKRKAALALEIIDVRWRMRDPSENSPLHQMSKESIRKWEERLRRGGNEFWEMSERGKALRLEHFDRTVKRAFGVETITADIDNEIDVRRFAVDLDLDYFELIQTTINCDFCHADTKEEVWNCRTFRFNTFEASWGIVGKGGTTFRHGIVYTCNDCASDIEECDQGAIVDRAAANLTIEFKHEISRPTVTEMVEKFIENRIK